MIAEVKEDIRYQALYPPVAISQYVHVNPETLHRWSSGRGRSLLLVPAARGIAPFSFINLIEAHVLVALRKLHGVPMQRIRKAVKWLSDRFETDHPLAEINLETDGQDLFVEYLNLKVSASEGGQIAIPHVVSLYLRRIERDEIGPIRFYPFTYDASPKRIVMDPRVDFGRPVIKGTRIETVMVFDRYSGGESLTNIAEDYDLKVADVEEALRCEIRRRAA